MNNKNWFGLANLRLLVSLAASTIVLAGLLLRPVPRLIAQDTPLPDAPPDAAAGLAIYFSEEANCVLCHGEMGDGTGPQALQAGFEPTSFSDPNYRLTAVPPLMFEAISNGNLSAGMPPYGPESSDPLSEADIWNLVALAYSYSTRPDDIAAGEALADELGADTAAWPGLEYWFSRSNQEILAELDNENILGVDLTSLSEEEKLSLVDYGRSLHYAYTDPLAAFAPVELAVISGQVINGTTNESLGQGEVRLRAFTVQLEEMFSETVPLNDDGSFEFAVENASPEWVFLADVVYGDLTFNSNAVQVSNIQPSAQMPIFVFETTADPSVVAIERLHMILSFAENRLLVSELYSFSNLGTAVFVGESGDFSQGTIEIGLPAGAENVDFQRAFGAAMDSFLPATEIVQTGTGWADTVPLRPGPSSVNLLVSYDLPYDDGLQLAHPLAYPVNSASVIMADAGVTITDDGWVSQGAQATPSGSFLSYTSTGLDNADALNLTLDGRPNRLISPQGNTLPVRNQTNELIIGVIGLGLALLIGLYFLQRWRAEPALAGMPAEMALPTVNPPEARPKDGDAQVLLRAIADLDDAYDAGDLNEADYQQERQALKDRLTAVWQ